MTKNTLSRRIRSPEDIRIGDYVAVTHTVCQFLPDFIEAKLGGGEVDLLHATVMPYNAGQPLKVVELSLPFVMTESPTRDRVVLDTRRHALARVSKTYAKAAKDKAQRKREKKEKSKRKRKGKKGKKK